MTVDSTTITNQVKAFGKQVENASDTDVVKYYFDPFIVEDSQSINSYGLHPMDDISDERFTDKAAMEAYAKGQLNPDPAISIEITGIDNEMPIAGEQRHLIAKPMNLETNLAVVGYTWTPFDHSQATQLSFANLPASILKTQANINSRIQRVQLLAQNAINAAKTGTHNYVSPTDPMKNDDNDVHTGDIWTLPLLSSTVKARSFAQAVVSDTNDTIYTDPDKMDKTDVQFSIWNGSQWLELSNQRTTNKLNDNIKSVTSQVQEAQAGIDTAKEQAQKAVDEAKSSGDAITKIKGGSESTIADLANDINLRVKTDDLISQINLQADNVLIQSGSGKGKLYLDADSVVFTGTAFIPSAAITEINADKITGNTASFVKEGFNGITSSLTIDGSNLNINSGNGGVSLNQNGINYVDTINGENVGYVSAQNWINHSDFNGIVQILSDAGDYMGWSRNIKNSDGSYVSVSKLVWYGDAMSDYLKIKQGWHVDDPMTVRELYATYDWHLNNKAIFFDDSGVRVWGDSDSVYFRNKGNNGNSLVIHGDNSVSSDGTMTASDFIQQGSRWGSSDTFFLSGKKSSWYFRGPSSDSLKPIVASAFNTSSLESMKTDIVPVDKQELTGKMYDVDLMTWRYKFEDQNTRKHIGGIIANENGGYNLATDFLSNDGKGVDMLNLIGGLIATVQTQNERIEVLESGQQN